jgi:hypothetical protein
MPNLADISADPAVSAVKGTNTGVPKSGVSSAIGVEGVSDSGFGVYGHSNTGQGVVGSSTSGRGIAGGCTSGYGVSGDSQTSAGVRGTSVSGRGTEGWSTSTEGVMGISTTGNGVWGQTPGSGIGVLGTSVGGPGVSGSSTNGRGVVGASHGAYGVSGDSQTSAGMRGTSVSGRGTEGWSTSAEGVMGISNTGNGIWGQTPGAGDGVLGTSAHGVGIHGKGGRLAGLFEGDVEVTGDLRLVNADCAEDFDISAASPVEPGTVMVLGPEGVLSPSSKPYDRRVAGVVSGAGSYRPGITLDSANSSRREGSHPRLPIGLLGKVFCKVDAVYGAIEIGDMLTTSPTPGHAMRATDPHQAFGAVIGKALRPHPEGQGLVPILISLQ